MARIGIAAILISIATVNAQAADISAPSYKSSVVTQAYNWTGLYAGVHGGYGTGQGKSIALAGETDLDGWFGGGQLGFNIQAPGTPWVIGIEADASFGSLNGGVTVFFPPVTMTVNGGTDFFGTARTRFGYAADRALLYVTGGIAWMKGDVNLGLVGPVASLFLSEKQTHLGFTVGGGVELAVVDGWSAKLEYQYLDLNSDEYFGPGGIDVSFTAHTFRLGLNYRFGDKTPVILRN